MLGNCCQCSIQTPIGFWSRVWREAEEKYSLNEKELLVTYSALQAVEPTIAVEVAGKTTPSIQGWVKDLSCIPKTGVAHTQTEAHWVTYLGQHSQFSSLLKKKKRTTKDTRPRDKPL